MRITETTWNNNQGPDREITIKIMAKRNLLKRLNQLVKSADWNNKIPAKEKWLGKTFRVISGFSNRGNPG